MNSSCQGNWKEAAWPQIWKSWKPQIIAQSVGFSLAFTEAGVKFISAHNAPTHPMYFSSSKYVLFLRQVRGNASILFLMASSLNPSMLAGMQRTGAGSIVLFIAETLLKSYLARPLHDYAPLAVFSTTVALIAPQHHPPFLCRTTFNLCTAAYLARFCTVATLQPHLVPLKVRRALLTIWPSRTLPPPTAALEHLAGNCHQYWSCSRTGTGILAHDLKNILWFDFRKCA